MDLTGNEPETQSPKLSKMWRPRLQSAVPGVLECHLQQKMKRNLSLETSSSIQFILAFLQTRIHGNFTARLITTLMIGQARLAVMQPPLPSLELPTARVDRHLRGRRSCV